MQSQFRGDPDYEEFLQFREFQRLKNSNTDLNIKNAFGSPIGDNAHLPSTPLVVPAGVLENIPNLSNSHGQESVLATLAENVAVISTGASGSSNIDVPLVSDAQVPNNIADNHLDGENGALVDETTPGGDKSPDDLSWLVGKDLHWINKNSSISEQVKKICIVNDRFSALNFDYSINTWEEENVPSRNLAILNSTSGSCRTFPEYIEKIASEIFILTEDLFPYEIEQDYANAISLFFFTKSDEKGVSYSDFEKHFKLYVKDFKSADLSFTDCVDVTEVLSKKIKHKFKYRCDLLKSAGWWPYTPNEMKKFEEKKIEIWKEKVKKRKIRKTSKRNEDTQLPKRLQNCQFGYAKLKKGLTERMLESHNRRSADATRRELARKPQDQPTTGGTNGEDS